MGACSGSHPSACRCGYGPGVRPVPRHPAPGSVTCRVGRLVCHLVCDVPPCRGACDTVAQVSAAHTDLGDADERASGYFDVPWDWEAMKPNAKFIHQFHSADDHLIPVRGMYTTGRPGARYVHYPNPPQGATTHRAHGGRFPGYGCFLNETFPGIPGIQYRFVCLVETCGTRRLSLLL